MIKYFLISSRNIDETATNSKPPYIFFPKANSDVITNKCKCQYGQAMFPYYQNKTKTVK